MRFTIYECWERATIMAGSNALVRTAFLQGTCVRPPSTGRGWRIEDRGWRAQTGDWLFQKRPMILRKLNQIRPDQTGAFTILDLRFTSPGLQAGAGGWFGNGGCRPKRPPSRGYGATERRRDRSAAAVQDAGGGGDDRGMFGWSDKDNIPAEYWRTANRSALQNCAPKSQ